MKTLAGLLFAAALSLSTHAFAKASYVLPMAATETEVDFGEVAVGDYLYTDIDVMSGDQDLTIAITQAGEMFNIAHNCPATLPAGKTCHIFIVFEPTADGDFTGETSVTTGVGDYLFHLKGTGYTEQ